MSCLLAATSAWRRFEGFERAGEPAFRREVLRLGVEAEEHGAQLAFAHAGDIELVVFVLVAEAVAFVDEIARRVDVGVEDQDVAHQPREAVLRRELRGGKGEKQDQTVHGSYYIGRERARYR